MFIFTLLTICSYIHCLQDHVHTYIVYLYNIYNIFKYCIGDTKMHQTGEIAGGGSYMSHFFCLCCDITNKEKGCPAAYRCSNCLRNDADNELGEITRSMVCFHQRYSIFYLYLYIIIIRLCIYIVH